MHFSDFCITPSGARATPQRWLRAERGPAASLMDVQMPEMDGLEATRRIVERWPDGERPHIVAMTANAMQGDREACLVAGMDDDLTMPIRTDALLRALNAVASRERQSHA